MCLKQTKSTLELVQLTLCLAYYGQTHIRQGKLVLRKTLRHLSGAATDRCILAIEKPMETQPRSTRVKAPTIIIHDVNATFSNSGCNDKILSNLLRRSKFDSKNGAGNTKLMNCKNETNISTLNVRTIRLSHKRHELVNNFTENGIDILGVVDHKIVHDDEPIRFEQFDNCFLITSSAWRNSNQAASGGVEY